MSEPKTEVVKEYVLYKGAYGDEKKQPLFSSEDSQLVQFHRLDEVRKANGAGVFSMSCRTVTYPLSADGKRQAIGSTCVETEV